MIINVIPHRKKRNEREITMSSNTADILKFLMDNSDEWYTFGEIAIATDIDVAFVTEGLDKLLEYDLIKIKEVEIGWDILHYQYIPQREPITFNIKE